MSRCPATLCPGFSGHRTAGGGLHRGQGELRDAEAPHLDDIAATEITPAGTAAWPLTAVTVAGQRHFHHFRRETGESVPPSRSQAAGAGGMPV